MASLAVMRAQLLVYLATTTDDPLFTTAVCNGFLKDVHHALVDEIHRLNRSYLVKDVLLTPDATTTQSWSTAPVLQYTLATQSPAITDFAYWVELRKTNDDGDLLQEAPLESLRDAGNGYFAVQFTDDSAVIRLSKDTEQGINVYMKYGYWPLDMQLDTDAPGGIPVQYHDVLPLEACFAFGLGGESSFPPELRAQWLDRKAALRAHVGKRGTWPSRTKVDPYAVEQYT
jgi:hypothetical protein